MGVILQQVDNINQVVSIAVVNKYGEVLETMDLKHLNPPRKFNLQPGTTDEEDQRYKKAK